MSTAAGILGLAWPILVVQLAVMAFAVVDTLLTGHASAADLAAMGVGGSVYASVFVTLTGAVQVLNPLLAHEHGAGRPRGVGATYVQGLWLTGLLSLLGMPFLAFPSVWFALVQTTPEVRDLASRYLTILSLALPAALLFRAVYALNTSIGRPRVVMALQLAGLGLKIALSAMLVFGYLGLPRLGVVGAGVASVIVFWALFVAAAVYMRVSGTYGDLIVSFSWPRWRAQREQLRLGIPMGLSSGLENTSFTLMTLLVAQLGTSVLAGHQIVSNLTAVAYQLPLALALATATLTAHAIGAADARRARHVARTGMLLCVLIAALSATTVWLLRERVVGLYTTDAAVAGVALSLIGYFSLLHVFDALQGVTAFVLRAYRVVIVPTVIYAFALWGPGLLGGYLVAFGPLLGGPRGAQGLWLMLSLALALTALLLLGFYAWVTASGRAGDAGRDGDVPERGAGGTARGGTPGVSAVAGGP